MTQPARAPSRIRPSRRSASMSIRNAPALSTVGPPPYRPLARLLRACRERPCSRGPANECNELAPFRQQALPCFEAEDSTAGDLLHCGISKEPLSAVGHSRRIGTLPTLTGCPLGRLHD